MRQETSSYELSPSGEVLACGGRSECVVPTHHMVATLRELVDEGNLRRISVKSSDGNALIELPLKLGLGPRRPVWTALAGLVADADEFAVAVQPAEAWPRRRRSPRMAGQDEAASSHLQTGPPPDAVDLQSEHPSSWNGLRL